MLGKIKKSIAQKKKGRRKQKLSKPTGLEQSSHFTLLSVDLKDIVSVFVQECRNTNHLYAQNFCDICGSWSTGNKC